MAATVTLNSLPHAVHRATLTCFVRSVLEHHHCSVCFELIERAGILAELAEARSMSRQRV
jgi:hypothetical protein